jgi:maltooligosyltrehalose synthase
MLVVAPRLVQPLLPEGAELPIVPREAWGDTRLRLPGVATGTSLTGRLAPATLSVGEGGTVAVAELLGSFPVALLDGEP